MLEEKTFSLCKPVLNVAQYTDLSMHDREELNISTRFEFDKRKNMEPYNCLFYALNFIASSNLPNNSCFQWHKMFRPRISTVLQ